MRTRPLGAVLQEDGRCLFRVWAPHHNAVSIRLEGTSDPREVMLEPRERGYHEALVEGVRENDRYLVRLGRELLRPDPASRAQPEGVHGPSMVMNLSFDWTDSNWRGLPLCEYVLYEIHVGAFTEPGTFEAVIPYLDDLRDLGVTCLEIMPVAAFPGCRNWGYDGVLPYAVQWSYGGLNGLRRLIDVCHSRDIAVCLDVVYNHMGPEGNYLRDFGPYFTKKYGTPWGEALNFDDCDSDEVRHYFLENARYWIEDVHVDALRLDAVHAIFDQSATPFLAEIASSIRCLGERLGRRVHAIAESDLHDPRMIRPVEIGGYAMHAEWNDDLHHSVHALLTGEREGYYADFGSVQDLTSVYNDSYAHAGRWTVHRRRRHGAPPTGVPKERFVVCVQNHDQVGNRLLGERLSTLVSSESLKLAAGAMLLSPSIPLLFMGEEYGEINPFLYFIDHGDPDLVKAVRRGRASEFASFGWKKEPPDPASEATFANSKLDRSLLETKRGATLRAFYKELLRLRREHPVLGCGKGDVVCAGSDIKRQTVWLRREKEGSAVVVLMNFKETTSTVTVSAESGSWSTVFDSADSKWGGPRSQVPARIESDGEIQMDVFGRSLMLLQRES